MAASNMKPKQRPKSITIFGRRIPIEYIEAFEEPETKGMFDPERFKITIKNDADWKDTLFHESIHSALFISGLTNSFSEVSEETVVCCIEHALARFFKI